jgi:hypothetical protein
MDQQTNPNWVTTDNGGTISMTTGSSTSIIASNWCYAGNGAWSVCGTVQQENTHMETYAWSGLNFIFFCIGFAILAATLMISMDTAVAIKHKRWQHKQERKQAKVSYNPRDDGEEMGEED